MKKALMALITLACLTTPAFCADRTQIESRMREIQLEAQSLDWQTAYIRERGKSLQTEFTNLQSQLKALEPAPTPDEIPQVEEAK